jgi:tetratricopeptide (TPR) repeat protein
MAETDAKFEFVIEAGLQELVDACGFITPTSKVSIELLYGQVIVHFLRGEAEEMKAKIQQIPTIFAGHPELEMLLTACKLREQIRLRIYDSEALKKALSLSDLPGRWQGELLILQATAMTLFNDYEKAMNFYGRSADSFQAQGCVRKALRARMNVLVCESHLYPNRNFFARYHDLYKAALKKPHRELIVATTCLLNISREYQRAGAPMAALKYCNHALALFERQMGELNYFLTLAHRAHLLCEMGRREEARIDFEAARLGQFKEVEAALQVVESLLKGEKASVQDSESLLPTWKERMGEAGAGINEKAVKLSASEEKLIQYLSQGPSERIDIIETLYGALLDHETKLNRFKSLLGTLRKKFPNLVLCENGKYRLADEILIPGGKASRSNTASSSSE